MIKKTISQIFPAYGLNISVAEHSNLSFHISTAFIFPIVLFLVMPSPIFIMFYINFPSFLMLWSPFIHPYTMSADTN